MGQLALLAYPKIYKPRSPASTVLYRAVANHWESFVVLAENDEKRIPYPVKNEFDAFLRCGIHAYGFLRIQCGDCKSEKFVAFSCKKRGFCSSCGGRRMNETAAHLIDRVFPRVGVRQWVVSFPMPVRFLLARSPRLQSKILGITLRAIQGLIRSKTDKKLQGGSVTILQRFGGSLNLNLHLHILALEGGYLDDKFHWIQEPTDEEIKLLIKTIAHRTVRALKKEGHFQDDQESTIQEETQDVLPELQAASIKNRVALGERQGQRIRRVGSLGTYEAPELTGKLQAQVGGFSLHAGVYCAPNERKKLEQLCRYIARPAVAEERLSLLANDNILLKLKKPYSDGTSHLIFSPLEFIEKLAALVPPPRAHLTRYHGVLAPHARNRAEIVPKTEETTTPQAETTSKNPRWAMGWAKLLKRTFEIDVSHCAECGGEMKILAAIMEREALEKILKHVGIPPKPPPIAPPRYPQQEPLFQE